MALSARLLVGKDYSTLQKGGTSLARRELSPWGAVAAYGWILLVLLVVLSPHLGVLLLSFAEVWSFAPLPDAYTLVHYATVFQDAVGQGRGALDTAIKLARKQPCEKQTYIPFRLVTRENLPEFTK